MIHDKLIILYYKFILLCPYDSLSSIRHEAVESWLDHKIYAIQFTGLFTMYMINEDNK